MIFGILSHFIFIEKTIKNHDFWISEISRIAKTLFFPWFFAKNENFDKFTSRWSEKKIFRDGSGGPKMLFNTILWYAAIKIWHRLIRFLHFWWFDFLVFLAIQKMPKIAFPKKSIFAIFFFKLHQFCSFLLFFSFFVSKIHFFYQNFNFVF